MLKFNRDVNSSVVWLEPWLSFLVVWVGSCLVVLVPTCPDYVIWGWNQCSHGLTSRPLESCHHQCLEAVCGVSGCPKGSAAELLDGTLKLPLLYPYFYQAIHLLGFYLGWARVLVKEVLLPLVIFWIVEVAFSQEDTARSIFMFILDPGHPTPRRWKRLRSPSSGRRGGEVGVPRNLFPRLFAPGTPGTCLGGNRRRGLVQPKHACVDMDRHVFVIAPSAPQPPQQPGV